jgi:hypothetical protein
MVDGNNTKADRVKIEAERISIMGDGNDNRPDRIKIEGERIASRPIGITLPLMVSTLIVRGTVCRARDLSFGSCSGPVERRVSQIR